MKKVMKILTILSILFGLFYTMQISTSAAEASGMCGDNITWTMGDYNNLYIEGTGDMYDYKYGMPWENYVINSICFSGIAFTSSSIKIEIPCSFLILKRILDNSIRKSSSSSFIFRAFFSHSTTFVNEPFFIIIADSADIL